jgi:hypothetical protein
VLLIIETVDAETKRAKVKNQGLTNKERLTKSVKKGF